MMDIYKIASCIVHPTYYPEGLSNVLLEACASGRPVITTNRAGCREVVDDGVNGFIVPMYEFFKGEFKTEIPFDLDNWEDYYNIELEELVGLATRYGLVLDTMHDIKIIRPRVKGQQFMEFCSKEQLEKYVKFFDELSDGKLAFEESMSYFTWSIPGHDDYYKFEKIDGVWYIFWITRYNPNF